MAVEVELGGRVAAVDGVSSALGGIAAIESDAWMAQGLTTLAAATADESKLVGDAAVAASAAEAINLASLQLLLPATAHDRICGV